MSDATETLAAEILSYLAEDTDRLSRFFDLTGLTAQTLRRSATQPEFAANLVEYLASDERLLLAFATDRDRNPAEIEAMRRALRHPNAEE